MTEFQQVISALREQMQATLTRSDVLKPLAWLVGLLLAALIGLALAKAPSWLLVIMALLVAASGVLYMAAFAFCLAKNPDALRSEKYVLQKLALEHNLIGDSKTGLFEEEQLDKPTAPDTSKQVEHKP